MLDILVKYQARTCLIKKSVLKESGQFVNNTELKKKIIGREHLISLSSRWHDKGKKIVLANGLFDILHVGHIRYLREARNYGDILLVAINSDKSVRALRGEKKPIINEQDRAYLVSGLEMVDYVTIFDETSVENILRIVKPHVHAKGTDYTKDNVPEKELAKELGIEIIIAGDEKNHATTDIIEYIVRNFC